MYLSPLLLFLFNWEFWGGGGGGIFSSFLEFKNFYFLNINFLLSLNKCLIGSQKQVPELMQTGYVG